MTWVVRTSAHADKRNAEIKLSGSKKWKSKEIIRDYLTDKMTKKNIFSVFTEDLTLSQLFFSVLQASQSAFLIFTNYKISVKMFSLYFYQLNKTSSDKIRFLVFIAFLESIPTFMKMGFVFTRRRWKWRLASTWDLHNWFATPRVGGTRKWDRHIQ